MPGCHRMPLAQVFAPVTPTATAMKAAMSMEKGQ